MEKSELLETLLFKNKLNTKTILDILPFLSPDTIENIFDDLENHLNTKEEKQSISIFTDGGCTNNGRSGARAGYAVVIPDYPNLDKTKILKDNPTNQRAELSAILLATKIIKENIELFKEKEVTIYSDSMYSIKCITIWSKSWQRNNWKGSNGKQVKNIEIISAILDNLKEIDVTIEFKHVFSHTSEPKNESKDSLKYKIWLGNKIVDERITEILNQHYSK